MAVDEPATPAPRRALSRRRTAGPGPEAVAAPPKEKASHSGPAVVEDGTSVDAERVHVRLSAIGRVQASEMSVQQGAVGMVRAEQLSVERGAVGAAMADRVEVDRGYARSILARQVQLDRAAARVIVAADVRANQTAVVFLIARRVSGEVKVLFDWRGALAFGTVAGVVFAILSRVRRRPR